MPAIDGLPHPLAFPQRSGPMPGILEAPSIGYHRWTPSRPHDLGNHAHPDQWEIHLVIDGQIDETIAGTTHVLKAGEVFLAAPGMEHSGIHRVRHSSGVGWMGVVLPPRGALPGMTAAQTQAIRQGFHRLAGIPCRADPHLLPAFAALLAEVEPPDALAIVRRRALVHCVLTLLLRSQPVPGQPPVPRSAPIAAAVALLSQDLARPLKMSALPALVGLRRTAFMDRFLAEMGMTPLAYRLHQRIEAAKPLLLRGSTAAAAAALGFASAQHLLRQFRRVVGCTPAVWRRQAAGGTV